MNQQAHVALDYWNPPKSEGRSGSFKAHDAQSNTFYFGCWPDKAAQAQPFVGSGQFITLEYSSREHNGKTYYDVTKWLDGAPQQPQAGPSPSQAPLPPAQQPQQAYAMHTPPQQPMRPAPAQQAAQAPQTAIHMPQKEYMICAQAFTKSWLESGQVSLDNPPEIASKVHMLIMAFVDAHRAHTEGRPYIVPTPFNPQADTPTAQALSDEIPDFN